MADRPIHEAVEQDAPRPQASGPSIYGVPSPPQGWFQHRMPVFGDVTDTRPLDRTEIKGGRG